MMLTATSTPTVIVVCPMCGMPIRFYLDPTPGGVCGFERARAGIRCHLRVGCGAL